MNPPEMIVVIVAIIATAGVLRTRFAATRADAAQAPAREDAEAGRLRDEVKQLKERLAVLERITIEKENSLEQEIERLRDK